MRKPTTTLGKLAVAATLLWLGLASVRACAPRPFVPPQAEPRMVCVLVHEHGCSWAVAAQPGETDEQVRARANGGSN